MPNTTVIYLLTKFLSTLGTVFAFLLVDFLIFRQNSLNKYETMMTVLASLLIVERIYSCFVLFAQEGGEEDGREEDHKGTD